jgi:hypothetical protein
MAVIHAEGVVWLEWKDRRYHPRRGRAGWFSIIGAEGAQGAGAEVPFRAPPKVFDPLQCTPAHVRAEALQTTSPLACESFVAAWPVAGRIQELLSSDYPRGFVNGL